MRIAIYGRVSTKRQDEMNQLLELRKFIQTQEGWRLETEYIDKVSGSGKKERPQFQQMMMDASQKKFDLLLFWALDRLSREGIVKTIGYLEQLKGWGVGWRSYSQPFLDTGNDMVTGIVLSVLAAVAKQERITISERTRAGLARAVKEGRVLGRRPVKVDVNKARKMQREGLGLRPIAAELGCPSIPFGRRCDGRLDHQKFSMSVIACSPVRAKMFPMTPKAMDSLDLIEAVMLIEEITETEIPDGDAENFSSPREMVDWLERHLSNQRPTREAAAAPSAKPESLRRLPSSTPSGPNSRDEKQFGCNQRNNTTEGCHLVRA